MKTKFFKTGAWVKSEKTLSGFYRVELFAPNGSTLDRVMCDDYRASLAYFKSFSLIARNY